MAMDRRQTHSHKPYPLTTHSLSGNHRSPDYALGRPFANFWKSRKFVPIEFGDVVQFRATILDILGVLSGIQKQPNWAFKFVRISGNSVPRAQKSRGCTPN